MDSGVEDPRRSDANLALSDASARREGRDATSRRLALILVAPLAILLVALVLVFFVLFERSTVTGASMLPTLHDRDYVLLTRGLETPQRGDVVILNVASQGRMAEWVKRVVALGGDQVDITGDTILVNGQIERFHHQILTTGPTMPSLHLIVPPGRIFVAGDNRSVSKDSRYVGTFAVSAIRGKVVAIYAPITRIGVVPNP